MFHLGQQVVCVNAANTNSIGLQELYEGEIYTIRWLGMFDYYGLMENILCLRVEETKRYDVRSPPEYNDCPFNASRFRPLTAQENEVLSMSQLELS